MANVQSNLDSHFAPYIPCFESTTRSVAEAGKSYLHGLYQSTRANMERMADVVAGSHPQRLHHMLSESTWDRAGVLRQLAADANAHFGRGGTALVIDESGFAKKGEHSAGVARQWNGRLGKTDNSQVGVFAAVTRGEVAALVDAELYLPACWTSDPARCEAAGIPESVEFRTKGEMALEMVLRARRNGLQFDWVAFDGGYGQLPWLLTALDGERETFLAEVHADQMIYLADPCPAVPERTGKGRAPARPVSAVAAQTVTAWVAGQSAKDWRRMKLRDGEKGAVVADFLTARVFAWDGESSAGRQWHLLVRREIDGTKLKFCLSNAKPRASLRLLVSMQASRHFVERAFEDAKGACGMADYQVRGWNGWHHHMALVMVALMFLAKERMAGRNTHRLLSCQDIVEMLRHKLPSKIQSDEDLVMTIANRHQRRQSASASQYRKQELTLPASFGGEI
ncbi:MAG: IS701 family transposase [Sulfuricella sp.]|nr:IS701 family transposase [Sulfuricella sp.]